MIIISEYLCEGCQSFSVSLMTNKKASRPVFICTQIFFFKSSKIAQQYGLYPIVLLNSKYVDTKYTNRPMLKHVTHSLIKQINTK